MASVVWALSSPSIFIPQVTDQDQNPNSGTLIWFGCCHFDQTSADIRSAADFGILDQLEQGTTTPGGGACTSAMISQLQFEYTRNAQLNIGQPANIGNMNVGESTGWFSSRVARKLGSGNYEQVLHVVQLYVRSYYPPPLVGLRHTEKSMPAIKVLRKENYFANAR